MEPVRVAESFCSFTLQECLKTNKKLPNTQHLLGTVLQLTALADVGAAADGTGRGAALAC